MERKELQQTINDTTSMTKENMVKLSDRGEDLEELIDKSDKLTGQASQFRRGSNRVRKRMWLKDMRLRLCLAGGVVLLLVSIIVLTTVLLRR